MPYKRRSTALQKPSTSPSQPRGGKAGPRKLSNMASQTEEADPPIQEHDNFAALMQAINTRQTTLTGKIDFIQLEVGLIRKDTDKFRI